MPPPALFHDLNVTLERAKTHYYAHEFKIFTIRPILGKNSKKEFQIILNFSQIKAVFSAAKNSL